MHVTCLGVEEDDVYKSLRLHCDLLTLHTTKTPVAFATATVRLNKITRVLETKGFLYTGVCLRVEAFSNFTYTIPNAKVYRDYPFYEEEVRKTHNIYALSYVRVSNENAGFTLHNFGNQRVLLKDNKISCKIMKDQALHDYHFSFSVQLGTSKPIESLDFVKSERCIPLKTHKTFEIRKWHKTTVISQLFVENDTPYFE